MAEWVLEDSPEKNTQTAYESAVKAVEAAERAERAAESVQVGEALDAAARAESAAESAEGSLSAVTEKEDSVKSYEAIVKGYVESVEQASSKAWESSNAAEGNAATAAEKAEAAEAARAEAVERAAEALASKNSAAESAHSAAASAVKAGASETAAKESETNAQTHEEAAATSAEAASQSAADALASKNAAAASASAAEASAIQAAASAESAAGAASEATNGIRISYDEHGVEGYIRKNENMPTTASIFWYSSAIPVFPKVADTVRIVISHTQIYANEVVFLDSDDFMTGNCVGYVISDEELLEAEKIVTIPQNAAYMFLCTSGNVNRACVTGAYYVVDDTMQALDLAFDEMRELMRDGDERVSALDDRTSLVSVVHSNNLFCPDTDIKATGKWWAKDAARGTVYIQENESTGNYSAIQIYVKNAELVTFSSGTPHYETKLYNWFAVDAQGKILSTFIVNQYLTTEMPVTATIPSGTVHLCVNMLRLPNIVNTFMVNAGESALPYEPYRVSCYIENLSSEVTDTLLEKTKFLSENRVKLDLPDKYPLVVGDTFELFWKGAVTCADYRQYEVEAICSKGNAYARKYTYTPGETEAGTYPLTVNLYDMNRTLLDTKSLSLVVAGKASATAEEKVVLCMGDSLIGNGYWPDELWRRLTAEGGTPSGDGLGNIAFIGDRASSNHGVPYCGYGGWTWKHYITEGKSSAFLWLTCAHTKTAADQHSSYKDKNGVLWKLETIEEGRIKVICSNISGAMPSASGTLTWVSGGEEHSDIVFTALEQAAGNPFWNEEAGKVDMASFVAGQGKASLDYIYVLLGWNMSGTAEDEVKDMARSFIASIHADFPDCDIILVGLEYPSRDGCGYNYGASSFINTIMQNVWKFNRIGRALAEENEHVHFIHLAGQFDTENNMMTRELPVNARNAKAEIVQINGVHPAYEGYMQIADACYRDMVHRLQA